MVAEAGPQTAPCAETRETDAMRRSWASSPSVQAVMRGNRGRDTGPEMRVRRLLHAAGLRYRVNYRPLASNRATADIVFTRAKVAVFIDGCFWHGCPEHHRPAKTNEWFWRTKVDATKERDHRTTEALLAAGWTVVRVWEHEDPSEVADRLTEMIRPA